MYLVTTPVFDQENFSEKKIYISELAKKNIHDESNNTKVLEYHWRDINDAKKDSQYIYDFIDELLLSLSDELNKYHKTKYELKYWKVLINPWLYYFLTKYYEHYLSCINAIDKIDEFSSSLSDQYYIPSTYYGFNSICSSNEYSSIIFQEILNYLSQTKNINKKNSKNFFDAIKLQEKEGHTQQKEKLKRNTNNVFLSYLKLVIKKIFINNNDKIILLSLESKNQNDLKKRVGEKNFKNFHQHSIIKTLSILNPKCNIDYEFRFNKITLKTKDNFKILVYRNILRHIPQEYVENFFHNKNIIKKNFKKKIKLTIIRTPLDFKTFNRFVMAETIIDNGQILSMQHGGAYGARDILGIEQTEINISDKYLTWGWKSKQKKIHPFYLTKDNWIKDYQYNKNGNILFTGASCKNSFHSFDEGQLPNHNRAHINNAVKLIQNLDNNSYKKFLYRFYYQQNFNEASYIKKIFPDIQTSFREEVPHFFDLLYNSKLLITSNDATTHKQGFIINHPTIMLLSKNFFNFREEAKIYYQELLDVGILYYDPVACAKQVNYISSNPYDWWMEKKTQNAKNNYNKYFCRVSKNYNEDMSIIIKQMIK